VGLSCAARYGGDHRTTSSLWALVFLSLAYAGILLQQPTCAPSASTPAGSMLAVFDS
jgi:hypothetical protein